MRDARLVGKSSGNRYIYAELKILLLSLSFWFVVNFNNETFTLSLCDLKWKSTEWSNAFDPSKEYERSGRKMKKEKKRFFFLYHLLNKTPIPHLCNKRSLTNTLFPAKHFLLLHLQNIALKSILAFFQRYLSRKKKKQKCSTKQSNASKTWLQTIKHIRGISFYNKIQINNNNLTNIQRDRFCCCCCSFWKTKEKPTTQQYKQTQTILKRLSLFKFFSFYCCCYIISTQDPR